LGSYELTAAELEPAAAVAVESAQVAPGDRVLDLGCGTGNAALLAARAGAQVTAVDPAARLLDVASARATAAGVDITFAPGDASSLPLADGSVDVVLSVFALIFSPDPAAAATECSRVLAARGRLVLTAWLPDGGPMQEMTATIQRTITAALGAPPPTPGFAWHDAEAVGALLAPHGLVVAATDHRLTFEAASAEAYFDQGEQHPMAVSGTAMLEAAGRADVKQVLRARALEILRRGNEDPDGFRISSRYRVVVAQR
jgi:ubiquinone/menaquinone biosynthesis C-methylase UbiE